MTNTSRSNDNRPRHYRVLRRPLLLTALAIMLAGGGVALWLTGGPGDHTPYPDAAWEKVVPGGDCQCADGSEFAFWDRQADPKKVMLFLNGGGVCWSATTCAFDRKEDDYPEGGRLL